MLSFVADKCRCCRRRSRCRRPQPPSAVPRLTSDHCRRRRRIQVSTHLLTFYAILVPVSLTVLKSREVISPTYRCIQGNLYVLSLFLLSFYAILVLVSLTVLRSGEVIPATYRRICLNICVSSLLSPYILCCPSTCI